MVVLSVEKVVASVVSTKLPPLSVLTELLFVVVSETVCICSDTWAEVNPVELFETFVEVDELDPEVVEFRKSDVVESLAGLLVKSESVFGKSGVRSASVDVSSCVGVE